MARVSVSLQRLWAGLLGRLWRCLQQWMQGMGAQGGLGRRVQLGLQMREVSRGAVQPSQPYSSF